MPLKEFLYNLNIREQISTNIKSIKHITQRDCILLSNRQRMSRLTGAPPRPFYKFENRFRRCASATLGSIGIPLVVASLSFEAALVCCAAWLGCWCTLQLVEQVAPGFFNQSDIASFDWINQECLKPFVNYNRYNFHSNVL